MEATENNMKNLLGHSADLPICKGYMHMQRGAASNGPNKMQGSTMFDKPCHKCGKKNHLPADCKYKDGVCNYCRKKGHLAKVRWKLLQAAEKGEDC